MYKYLLYILIITTPKLHADNLTLLLDWYMNPNHAPLYVAQKYSFFEKKGLNVQIQTPPDLQTPPKLVALNKADLALTYQYHLHLFVNQKLPLIRIATLIETPLNCLAVKANGPIQKIEDLKGKKIGYKVGLGSSQAFIGSLLNAAKLSLKDVEMIRSSHSLVTPFLAGQLDAMTGIYRNVEPFLMHDKGTELKLFYYEEHGVPPFDELIIVANAQFASSPKIRLFVDALEEAAQYLINHRHDCLESFKKDYPEQKNNVLAKIWEETMPRFALRPGMLDHHRYARFAHYLKEANLIHETPDVSTYATDVQGIPSPN